MAATKPNQKKGFRLPERTALLKFEGDYDGAEVRVRLNVPLGYYLGLSDFPDEQWLEVYRYYVEQVVIEWNLLDDSGEPIPTTKEGASLVAREFIALVLREWRTAMAQVPDPLDVPSTSGST